MRSFLYYFFLLGLLLILSESIAKKAVVSDLRLAYAESLCDKVSFHGTRSKRCQKKAEHHAASQHNVWDIAIDTCTTENPAIGNHYWTRGIDCFQGASAYFPTSKIEGYVRFCGEVADVSQQFDCMQLAFLSMKREEPKAFFPKNR